VDQEARAAGILRRAGSADAVALLADHEEQSQVGPAALEQALGCGDHGGDDALGVSGGAPPDELVVFVRGEEGWNRIHVSGHRHYRTLAELREDVEAMRLRFHPLDLAIEAGGEAREMALEELANLLLVARDGLDIDERARKLEYIH